MLSIIRGSLRNPYAVTVLVLTMVVFGVLTALRIPIDILPVFKSPAVQVLTFYGGMPASGVEKDITNRMERWTGQAAGTSRQESRSIVGASVVRNYFRQDIDPNGALTQVNSLASAAIPNLPPGTLPPVILPFDPTSSTPVCIVALDSKSESESILYDVGRYEVRNMIMAIPGSVAPVVYGGKLRAIMAYLDRTKMQARGLSPVDVMRALDSYNLFLPTGDVKFGGTDYAVDSNSMYDLVKRMGDIPLRTEHGNAAFLRDVANPADASFIQTNIVRVNGRRQVYIPVFRQSGSSTLAVVDGLKKALPDMKARLSRQDINLKVVMDQSVYVRHSIESLVEEGVLGAVLCSLVILLFLGEWRMTIIAGAVVLLGAVLVAMGVPLRREFFPEVDAGAFEIYVRAPSGTRIEQTEEKVAQLEDSVRKTLGDELELTISELGVTADWSAAYTSNAGPMDAVMKIQLTEDRKHSAQEWGHALREGFAKDSRFGDLEFAFDAGGMIRGAMNEGKSTPLNVRITARSLEKGREVAEAIQREVSKVKGVVDCRIVQRLDYPEYVIDVDRAKAADLGFNQDDIMKNVVAALNSSIQFNKKNFWIDPVSHNQYYVGVQYPEEDIKSLNTLLDIPVTSPAQKQPIPLRNVVSLRRASVPAELTHANLQSTIDLTMGVDGRDLGHVADDVTTALGKFGKPLGDDTWVPFDPSSANHPVLEGSKIRLSGEYSRMQDTFRNLGIGLLLATLLIYFLLVALFKSYVIPLVILFAVPIGLVGVVAMLYVTNTAINVQSLLGVIFLVGIVVSNTVLLIDFAEKIRKESQVPPTEAIRRAAAIRVRPIVMTALAAFFALIPMALALARGSEANAPLGRSVIGGLLAGLVTTLFVVPALYSLVARDSTGSVPDLPDGIGEPPYGSSVGQAFMDEKRLRRAALVGRMGRRDRGERGVRIAGQVPGADGRVCRWYSW